MKLVSQNPQVPSIAQQLPVAGGGNWTVNALEVCVHYLFLLAVCQLNPRPCPGDDYFKDGDQR